MINKTQETVGWQKELWMKGLDVIEGIAETGGYEHDDISDIAMGAVLASLVDEAYSIGVCVGAASKEEQGDRICFRNQN